MKVQCINDDWGALPSTYAGTPPKLGDVDFVVEEKMLRGVLCYILQDYSPYWGYRICHFKPFDDSEYVAYKERAEQLLKTSVPAHFEPVEA